MVEEVRLKNLQTEDRNTKVGRGYSWFVKVMRLALPLTAIILVIIVTISPTMKDQLVVVPKESIVNQNSNEIGENELLNPNFETLDSNQRPVQVTADRALQNPQKPNLLRLENPHANLQTKDGSKIQVYALSGAYEQETEKLFLKNKVKIKHESGYQLNAEELRIDMKTKQAFSDKTVTIDGPAATIQSMGLEGSVDNGILVFKGPATLTLIPSKDSEI